MSPPPRTPSSLLARTRALCGVLTLALGGSVGCKADRSSKSPGGDCNPEDEAFEKVRVVIEPTDQLNVDDEGNPLSVVFHLYQLSGDTSLQLLDFDTVWQQGGAQAFGDELVDETEMTIYPEKIETVEIDANPEVTHIVAAAIYRDPIGQDWFRVWETPKYHGASVCAAKARGQTWEDPCFFVLLDRYLVDGGHTPPAGFDRTKVPWSCPGPPSKIPPPTPAPEGKRDKKKKKRKLEDAKAPEAPQTPEAPQAPDAPQAPEAPQAPQAPTMP